MNLVQEILSWLNELLEPLAGALNAPVVVVGGGIVGIMAAIVGGLVSASRSKKQDEAIEELKVLTQKQSELIERALAVNADKLTQSPETTGGADPREALRSALEDYVTSDDPRGQKVTELVAERRSEEAQALAFAIAGETAAEIDRLTSDARRKAAQKWKDAGAIAYLNDPKSAMTAYERARHFDAGDAETLISLGVVYFRLGRLADAEETYQDAKSRMSAYDQETHAAILGNLGLVAKMRGDTVVAEDYFRRALQLAEELGSKEGMAAQLGNLGQVAKERGDLATAEKYLMRALRINEELGRKEGMAIQLGNLGQIAKARGDVAAACAFWTRAQTLFLEVGHPNAAVMERRMKDERCG